jgi:hypothetical protein
MRQGEETASTRERGTIQQDSKEELREKTCKHGYSERNGRSWLGIWGSSIL